MTMNSSKDGRLLTQKSLSTDYTLSILKIDDGKLKLSNNLKTINNIDDIGSSLLRKVDHVDVLPSLDSSSADVNYGYVGRTVVYSGDDIPGDNNPKEGNMYRCVPVAAYTWTDLAIGYDTDLLKFERSVTLTTAATNGEYMIFHNGDGNSRVIFYIYGGAVKMAVGCDTVTEAEASANATIYTSSDMLTFSRTPEINDYICTFNGCTVASMSGSSLAKMIRCHVAELEDPSPAFVWELITAQDKNGVTSFDTFYPLNNVCILNSNPCCFFIGTVPIIKDNITFTLDASNLAIGQYNNNNILFFKLLQSTTVKFIATDAFDSEMTVHTLGDPTTKAGTYRTAIEVLPDNTITTTTTLVDEDEVTETVGTIYGIRCNLDSTDTSCTKIIVTRSLDSNGNITENINTAVTTFPDMPCHNLRRCVMSNFKNGVPAYYLYPNNSLEKADGSYADLTGADGDVAVEIPKAYLRVTKPVGSGVSLTSGYIDYVISDKQIPDPPSGTVDAIIYNGVHPFFRAGGDIELDGNGNTQYEKMYNPTTGELVDTDIVLRTPKRKEYVGAFSSVNAHLGTLHLVDPTLKAIATTISETVTPSGTFADYANYPKRQNGFACGGTTNELSRTMARSIAPYRNGELTYVGLPGVRVIIYPSNDSFPLAMPGGCNTMFACDAERSFTYVQTTDTTFQPGVTYFTTDGTKYTAAKVVVGAAITGTYYIQHISLDTSDEYIWYNSYEVSGETVERKFTIYYESSAWHLKMTEGSTDTIMAHSSAATSSTALENLTWTMVSSQITDPDTSVVYPIDEFSVKSQIYKLTIGPIRYGTRAADFLWSNQTSWDNALAGNPNWALNYRPTSCLPSIMNMEHAAGYTSSTAYTYGVTSLRADLINEASEYSIAKLATGSNAGTLRFSTALDPAQAVASDPSNLWIGLTDAGSEDENYTLSVNAPNGGWIYHGGTGASLVSDMSLAYIECPFTATEDTLVLSGKTYYERNGVGPDYTYSVSTKSVGDSATGLFELTKLSYPTRYHFIDSDHKYMTLFNTSIARPSNINTSIAASSTEEPSVFEFKGHALPSISVATIYERHEGAIVYKLEFDHAQLKWYIDSIGDASYREYESNRLLPGTMDWSKDNLAYTTDDRAQMIGRDFAYEHDTANGVLVSLVPELTSGLNKTTFNYVTAVNPIDQKWTNILGSNLYQIEFVTNDNTVHLADEFYATLDTTFQTGEKYYTRIGEGTELDPYVYTEDTSVVVGDPIPANTYFTNGLARTYGGQWCVIKYEGSSSSSTALKVITSDLDFICTGIAAVGSVAAVEPMLFRPVNPEYSNVQRTYDSVTGATTNATLVYKPVQFAGTAGYYLVFFVDENGNLPKYIVDNSITISGLQAITANYHGRWVMVKFTSSDYDTLAVDDTQTAIKPVAWSASVVNSLPSMRGLLFTGYNTNDSFKNLPNAYKVNDSQLMRLRMEDTGRPFNINHRFKQYLALLAAIEYGDFDIGTMVTKGKVLTESTISYSKETFSGRTVELGNNTGSVVYDPDIDINIQASDFSDSSDRVVAWSYRGVENPFGNTEDADEGCYYPYYTGTRWICLDPKSYASGSIDYLDKLRPYISLSSLGSTTGFVSQYFNIPFDHGRLDSVYGTGYINKLVPEYLYPYTLTSTAPSTGYGFGKFYLYGNAYTSIYSDAHLCAFHTNKIGSEVSASLLTTEYSYNTTKVTNGRLQY